MGYWRLQTMRAPAGPGSGTFSDADLRLRFRCWVDMIVRAENSVREAQRELDVDMAAARTNGQGAIVEEALRDLAERRASALRP